MFKARKDRSLPKDGYDSALEFYGDVRNSLKEKADHNKWESQLCFFSVICFSLLSPLFVTLGTGLFLGKIMPAGLSVCAAAATSWLQLRKPQRLWALYRRAQRELEREKTSFDFQLEEYKDAGDTDKLLAQRVSDIAFKVHEQWEGLVPNIDGISSLSPRIPMEKVEDVAEK